GIAHDFNNLLAGLLGSLELVQMEINSEVKRSKHLKTIKKAFIRTRELTNRLILFSEGTIPVKETLSINALLNDSIGSFLNDSDIKVKFSIPDNIWFVNIDKGQIKLVIDNIFINAVEAVNKKGQVQVNCKNIEKSEKDPLFLDRGKYVRIDIKDDGCGISEENINKIFDPYFSTKELGTNKGQGLGLAVCHSIIKKHNGAIFVISDLEKGTTVSIYLPGLENNA
ncbi:MAG: hybrid sensor histidine kinase/response regulator, partial [Desulfobacteraceae bacterium]|nr:hybrid sensor histidine kinase/response regulator [Desulfobacteraceae bacterium]